ncbi:IS200/IS605 family transposase [Faecalitalea cylindroides]|uniref:IS200/IS605 family transposase n=1 Tax=Faecalitalea cylindroides TaxID=39483 RepID=UPI0024909840|nr:IS200/IS605 family transposase [Faecalitalea cylindroides]
MNKYNNYDYDCKYHIVIFTNWRYFLLENEEIINTLQNKIIDMQREKQFQLLEFNAFNNMVYLKVQCVPDVSPLTLMKHIRHQTAIDIKNRFPKIKKSVPAIWTKKGILSTNTISKESIQEFIEKEL